MVSLIQKRIEKKPEKKVPQPAIKMPLRISIPTRQYNKLKFDEFEKDRKEKEKSKKLMAKGKG